MIVCRSAAELERMREAGRLVGEVLTELAAARRAGRDDGGSRRDWRRSGFGRPAATPAFKGYHGYPATICASINEEVIHGIPSGRRVLDEGDIISIDVGASLDGYFGDSAITLPVGHGVGGGGDAAAGHRGVALQGDRARCGRAGACRTSATRCSSTSRRTGFRWCASSSGHGIGQQMHEEPQVPNYGEPGRGPRLAEGMVLAIEPMVNAGKPAVKVLADGWTAVTRDGSLSAHFEHTVAVTAGEPWILTAREVPVGRESPRER